jgi:hypothetical protein
MNVKVFFILVWVNLLCSVAFGQGSFNPGTEPAGFGGVPWGTPVSAFPGLAPDPVTPGLTMLGKLYPENTPATMTGPFSAGIEAYVKQGDVMEYEGVPVDEINYLFKNGRFYSVMILTRGQEAFDALSDALTAVYGQAEAEDAASMDGSWRGEKTQIRLDMIVGGAVNMTISSIEE